MRLPLPIKNAAQLHRLMRAVDIAHNLTCRGEGSSAGRKRFQEEIKDKSTSIGLYVALCRICEFVRPVLANIELELSVEISQESICGEK